jgi:GT2 family glycosyltransferase
MKIAVVGHKVYFENHYAEDGIDGVITKSFDFDHYDWDFVYDIIDFNPDCTLFYRPELYNREVLQKIPGHKYGFSTEPLPKTKNGITIRTSETDWRENNYKNLCFDEFNSVFHYDDLSQEYAQINGLNFSGYREIPINTNYFNPFGDYKKKWDVLFIGKATQRRNDILNFLTIHPSLSFLWIAHGTSGNELADCIKQSRCVLNIHADELLALEPRVYLAAACGIPVVTEKLSKNDFIFSENVISFEGELTDNPIFEAIQKSDQINERTQKEWVFNKSKVSVVDFIKSTFEKTRQDSKGGFEILPAKKITIYTKSNNIEILNNISIIVNSHKESNYKKFEKNIFSAFKSKKVNIIRIRDALSMADGYNRGAMRTARQHLIFCHDDIEVINDNFMEILEYNYNIVDVFGPCGSTYLSTADWYDSGYPYTHGHIAVPILSNPIEFELQVFSSPDNSTYGSTVLDARALDGLFIASNRTVHDSIKGFDAISFNRFMCYDIDYSYRAHLAGFRVGISRNINIIHNSDPSSFSEEKISEWNEQKKKFMNKHLSTLQENRINHGQRKFVVTKENISKVLSLT